ncbi:nucleotide binding protein [[Candida] boidinii]|nr:nucleotide binding protein [[Candida] boidinii]
MKDRENTVAILYGSETGNSQEYAETLCRKFRYLRFKPILSSLDDFDLKKLLDIKILIIICSTTGQGELTRNSKKFWKFMLKKKLPNNFLDHLNFTTFGLGDSSYPKFNYAIRKIHKRLLQLGAKEFCDRSEGDEQSPEGPDAFYSAWEEVVLSSIKTKIPFPPGLSEINEDELLPPTVEFKIHSTEAKKDQLANQIEIAIDRNLTDKQFNKDQQQISNNKKKSENSERYHIVEVIENKRITADDHFQDVRTLTLKDKENSMHYKPGDTISLYPFNEKDDVELLIKILNWENICDYPIEIISGLNSIEGGLVNNLTIRTLLTHHLDIMSIPRRSFFELIWHFASNELEIEKLKEFSTIEESEALYDYANRPRRSILEVLQEFSSLKLPIEYLFDLFPIIKPRLFSISSYGLNYKSQVELTIAIVEYKTMIRRIRKGVCTRWLKDEVKVNDKILISINNNTIELDNNTLHDPSLTTNTVDEPLIMISPGTGIAPMKCAIEYHINNNIDREMVLFCGNRYKDKDFLYGDLLTKYSELSKLKILPSFSRSDDIKTKGYVQDKLYKEKNLVNDLIFNKKSFIYLCGSSGKMPTQVRITIETILEECNESLNETKAKEYLLELENKNYYIQETW